jgi:hypothetical protein
MACDCWGCRMTAAMRRGRDLHDVLAVRQAERGHLGARNLAPLRLSHAAVMAHLRERPALPGAVRP